MPQRWAVEDSLAQRFAIRRIRDLRSFQGCKNKPSPDSYRDWFVFSSMETEARGSRVHGK